MISGAELILLVLVISEVMKFVLHVYGVFKENTTLRASRLELLKWYACIVGLSLPVFFATREPFPFSDHIVVLVSFTLSGLAYFFGQVLVRRCRDSGWPKVTAYFTAAPYIGGIVVLLLLFWKPAQEPTVKS